jgi:hypothetical protein
MLETAAQFGDAAADSSPEAKDPPYLNSAAA